MSVLYSRKAGKQSAKTLWADDYLALKLTDSLSPTTESLGFKTYVETGKDAPTFESEASYLERLKDLLDAAYQDPFTNDYCLALTSCYIETEETWLAYLEKFGNDSKGISVAYKGIGNLPTIREEGEDTSATSIMNAPRRSSMLANSMSSVPENPNNPSSSANPVNGAFQRREARQHMLKAMRAPPLQYAWTFWHDKHSDSGSYEGRLTAMLENIITLKPFWEVYNTFPLDALKMKDSVHFFKRGVRPVWEDPRNVKGGAWTFRVPKDKSAQTWLEILLIAIGEGFADVIQPKDDLCGISYSVRFNSNLITVWNRDGANQKSIDGIRNVILDKISTEIKPREGTFYYKRHSEHAGFNDVVSKAAAEKEAAKEGKIEEATVTKEEEKQAEEEAEQEEATAKGKED